MKVPISILLLGAISLSSIPSISAGSSRIDAIVQEDTTERLEKIYLLKKSLRELNIQLEVVDTALKQVSKKPNYKKVYSNTKKVADAITALTILGGTIASYRFKNEVKIIKIASFIGGLSASTSVISSLLSDLSDSEAEALKAKIRELVTLISASNINLNREIRFLCKSEPSNQMCK